MGDGAKANMSGKKFERLINGILTDSGYQTSMCNDDTWYHKPENQKDKGFSDIMVFDDGIPSIRIECKFQNSQGSVSEKINYFFIPLLEGSFTEEHFVIVLSGEHFKKYTKIIPTLRKRALMFEKLSGKSITIIDYDSEDFLSCIRELI